MSKTDDGGFAFPLGREQEGWWERGMSLRDWFAGQVLSAVVKQYAEANGGIGHDHLLRNCPIHAYAIADAMLEARKR